MDQFKVIEVKRSVFYLLCIKWLYYRNLSVFQFRVNSLIPKALKVF